MMAQRENFLVLPFSSLNRTPSTPNFPQFFSFSIFIASIITTSKRGKNLGRNKNLSLKVMQKCASNYSVSASPQKNKKKKKTTNIVSHKIHLPINIIYKVLWEWIKISLVLSIKYSINQCEEIEFCSGRITLQESPLFIY